MSFEVLICTFPFHGIFEVWVISTGGDVSNVVFTNGAIARANGDVYIYYASSDTRLHAASTTGFVISAQSPKPIPPPEPVSIKSSIGLV